ncbi:PIN domain-containing protein [uncultured Idiomarina sp.]|uniref:PIN domain-containing protein n=1 Tax=uncultured Idiomarina sp. TaxID=352961 RepID=UPI002593BAA8|nr:PIN domain-containing protein [uncultured Idiomarina sp.]
MSEKPRKSTKELAIFSLEEAFPDADGIFNTTFKKLNESYENALIVFDTNVLLLPYSMGNEGLEQLKVLYRKLIDGDRLFIPKRVAREFAKNRNKKLAEIYNSVLQRKSGKSKNNLNYPILENLDEKRELDETFSKLEDIEKAYYKAIDKLASTIRSWEWSDPVSSMYSELFNSEVLIDHSKTKDELVKELERRFSLQIPPGYKDSNKDDGGVGDLSIWLSLLELGERKRKDIIFVTEDVKSDWWNQSNGSEFLPRYELIDEFRRETEGNTLHIVRLSKLLEIFKVEQRIIEEALAAEKKRKENFNRIFQAMRDRKKREAQMFSSLSREDAISELKAWFFSNYEDPAHSCPYETKEGGYQYIWGGPYDAREEIENEYSGVVSDSVIDEVVDDLESECLEWSGVPDEYPEDGF